MEICRDFQEAVITTEKTLAQVKLQVFSFMFKQKVIHWEKTQF